MTISKLCVIPFHRNIALHLCSSTLLPPDNVNNHTNSSCLSSSLLTTIHPASNTPTTLPVAMLYAKTSRYKRLGNSLWEMSWQSTLIFPDIICCGYLHLLEGQNSDLFQTFFSGPLRTFFRPTSTDGLTYMCNISITNPKDLFFYNHSIYFKEQIIWNCDASEEFFFFMRI